MKVEKLAKNGQMVQNCYPLSPGVPFSTVNRAPISTEQLVRFVYLSRPPDLEMVIHASSRFTSQRQPFQFDSPKTSWFRPSEACATSSRDRPQGAAASSLFPSARPALFDRGTL